MQTLEFRPADWSDLADVHALYMDPTSNPYLAFDLMDEKEFARLFEDLLAEGFFGIATLGNRTVGCFHFESKKYRQSDTLYLTTLVVHPDERGKKYAQQILRHVLDIAMREGKNRVELVVSVNNPAAVALYEKCGFRIEGRIRESYRIGREPGYYDDYLMGLLTSELKNG